MSNVEEFKYDPRDWENIDSSDGPNRVIRSGGGERTATYPPPKDPRYMPSFFEKLSGLAEKRELLDVQRRLFDEQQTANIGRISIQPDIDA